MQVIRHNHHRVDIKRPLHPHRPHRLTQVVNMIPQQPRLTVKQRYRKKVARPRNDITAISDHFTFRSHPEITNTYRPSRTTMRPRGIPYSYEDATHNHNRNDFFSSRFAGVDVKNQHERKIIVRRLRGNPGFARGYGSRPRVSQRALNPGYTCYTCWRLSRCRAEARPTF